MLDSFKNVVQCLSLNTSRKYLCFMEKIYAELKKKYALPDFVVLDKEFEISLIDSDVFVLREIRRRIADKIESALKLLDNLLHPDSGFASLFEADSLISSDRQGILILYKQLMFFYRMSSELHFDDSDASNADFINGFVKEWPSLKKSLLFFIVHMRDSWKKEIGKKEYVGYLG